MEGAHGYPVGRAVYSRPELTASGAVTEKQTSVWKTSPRDGDGTLGWSLKTVTSIPSALQAVQTFTTCWAPQALSSAARPSCVLRFGEIHAVKWFICLKISWILHLSILT